MRLVLSRAAAARTLLVAAALATTATTVLLTALVLYAQLLPVAGARAALREAPPDQRSVQLSAPAGDLAGTDSAVRDLLGHDLAGAPLSVSAGGYAAAQELPSAGEGEFPVVGFLTGLAEHAELVAGDWPAPGADPPEVTMPEAAAGELGLEVGDRVTIVDGRVDEPVPLVVAGLWRPADPTDPYWLMFRSPLARGGLGPFLLHPDDFAARYPGAGTLEWVAAPDPARLAEADLAGVRADVEALTDRLAERQPSDANLGYVRMRTGLGELAGRLAVATVVNRSGMVLPAALVAVIAGFGLVLCARLLAAHRRAENALLRARGADRRQLVRLTLAEALLVVIPAAVLGPPLGAWLVGVVDDRAGARSLGIAADLAAHGWAGPPLAWLVAAAAAGGCAAALALPAASGARTWVAEQQERSRPTRAAVLQRAGVDVALVAVAVLGWWQLQRYGTAVTPTGTGLGIDPLLVAAPVVGVVAATALSLRLLPLVSRLGARLAARRAGLPSLLGMWQADRRPHAGPVLLLVLAVATAVLAPAVAGTWQRSQRDQAAQAVGADLRVAVADPQASAAAELPAALPGATGLMPVSRSTVDLPDGGTTTLLALDTEPAASVVRLRPDVSSDPEALFARLHAGRPELAGIPLPAGARRLAGQVRFTTETRTVRVEYLVDGEVFSYEEQIPSPVPGQLSAYVLRADGVVRAVPAGTPGQGGWFRLDVPLPAESVALVGLGAEVDTDTPFSEIPPGTATVPASWRWRDLRALGVDGTETSIELPEDWLVRAPDGGPDPEWHTATSTARVELRPAQDFPGTFRLLITPPADLSVLPVAASPDVLDAMGAEVGDTLTITGRTELPGLRVVERVAAIPGTADGAGIMVDLSWLATHQYLHGRPSPETTEWWVAGPVSGAAVEDLAWTGAVSDRRLEAQRRLEDPLGSGVLISLWAAAAGSAVLAGFGLVVDSRATAVRRRRELAVLHTLGTPSSGLARALLVEQAVVAGLGGAAGLLVGIAVTAAMGPSLVLTSAGEVPVPAPLLTLSPAQLVAPALGLFLVAVGLGAAVARRGRREVAAGALRAGED